MELSLDREKKLPRRTIGTLFVDGKHYCHTCEDTVREEFGVPVSKWKVQNETAIPEGRYRVLLTPSARFKRVMLQVMDVPGFAGIRIHGGNTEANTEGCLLVGRYLLPDDAGISDSKAVLAELEARVKAAIDKGEEVWLSIS